MQNSPKKKHEINCPECRKTSKIKLISKDLIAYKIINDLEISCENEYCE